MLDWSLFNNVFFVSVLLALIFGLLSFFIVLRKMTFLGAGISHVAFGGAALGILIGIHPFISSLLFSIAAAMLIGLMIRTGRISYDSGIGILFSFAMALGVIFLTLKTGYKFPLYGYLFGSILGISGTDLTLIVMVTMIFIPFILIYFQRLLYMAFDESVAKISGVPVVKLDMILHIFLATIIVVSMKAVGIILVTALIVLPASFGMLFSTQYMRVIIISILYSIVIMIGGLLLSYIMELPPGATMVTLGTFLYLVTLIAVQIKNRI